MSETVKISTEQDFYDYFGFYANDIKILFVSVCPEKKVNFNFLVSYLHTTKHLDALGIKHDLDLISEHKYHFSVKSSYFNKVILDNKSEYTHLFFIDGDLSWEPLYIIEMIKHKVGVQSAVVPSNLNLKDISSLGEVNKDLLKYKLLDYDIEFKDKKIQIKNQLAEIEASSLSFILLQKEFFKDEDFEGKQDSEIFHFSDEYSFKKIIKDLYNIPFYLNVACNINKTVNLEVESNFLKSKLF